MHLCITVSKKTIPLVFVGRFAAVAAVSATVAAILYFVPYLFPFLSPGKRTVANKADLLW